MRTFISVMFATLLASQLNAQENKMVVHKTDGTTVEYNVSEIEKVTFSTNQETGGDDSGEIGNGNGELNISGVTQRKGFNYSYYFWDVESEHGVESDKKYCCLAFYTFDFLSYKADPEANPLPSTASFVGLDFIVDSTESNEIPVGEFTLAYFHCELDATPQENGEWYGKTYEDDNDNTTISISKDDSGIYTLKITNGQYIDSDSSTQHYPTSFTYTGTIGYYNPDTYWE